MRRLALGVAAMLPLAACAALGGGRPQIENRFARQLADDGVAVPRVAVDVTTSAVEAPPTSVAITQLSDRGQAALIRQSAGAVPVAIKAPVKPAPTFALRDHFARHITVAVRPLGFLEAGDRVDAVRIRLEVAAAQASTWAITSWTAASNGQTTIDLGHLSDTRASKVGVAAGIAGTAAGPSATIAGESSSSRTRDVEIRDTTDFDAAVDGSGRAWLDETAGWRVSLAHNLSMDAVVTTTTTMQPLKLVTAVYPDKPPAAGAAATAIRLVETIVYTPAHATAPICGHAALTYRIRHILNAAGRATFTESDDEVTFLTSTTEATFLLAPTPYEPAYVIAASDRVLHYQMANAAPAMLVFATLDEAALFRDAVRRTADAGGRIANARVGFDRGGKLEPAGPGDLERLIPRVADPTAALAAITADATGCRSPTPASPPPPAGTGG